jgi:hypothetical protein
MEALWQNTTIARPQVSYRLGRARCNSCSGRCVSGFALLGATHTFGPYTHLTLKTITQFTVFMAGDLQKESNYLGTGV